MLPGLSLCLRSVVFKYKVFRQAADHSFVEIAQTTFLEDAESVYARWHSAMISELGGEIIQVKNLESREQAVLFGKGQHA